MMVVLVGDQYGELVTYECKSVIEAACIFDECLKDAFRTFGPFMIGTEEK